MSRNQARPPKRAPRMTRLYISPLAPHFLNAVLPPLSYNAAKNITYHEVETFPEKAYGYLDLPEDHAQRLKSRLNGSTLKGNKMKVEIARDMNDSMKKRKADFEEEKDVDARKDAERTKRAKSSPSKSLKEDGVVPGVELSEGRHVKRGWTHEQTDGSKGKKGPKTKPRPDAKLPEEGPKEHAIMRTTVPPNKSDLGKGATKDKKRKSRDEVEEPVRGKRADVKEFTNTTSFPSFLRQDKVGEVKSAAEYVDGKGWVDEDGNIVEAEKPSKRARKRASGVINDTSTTAQPNVAGKSNKTDDKKADKTASVSSEEGESSIISDSSSEPSSSSSSSDEKEQEAGDESSSDSSTSSTSRQSEPAISTTAATSDTATAPLSASLTTPALADSVETHPQSPPHSSKEKSKSRSKSPLLAQPSTETSTATDGKEVHPLESLFKRPAPATSKAKGPKKDKVPPKIAPIDTSFSFSFAEDVENDDDIEPDPSRLSPPTEHRDSLSLANSLSKRDSLSLVPPQTPFTRRDRENRTIRSAAPTPDTAAIGKRFKFPWGRSDSRDSDDERDEEQEGEGDGGKAKVSNEAAESKDGMSRENGKEKEQTEFEKQFYAQRGEFTRDWKARKREAKRETKRGGRGGGRART